MAGQLRAIVYSRVCTGAQERDGTSLYTQDRHAGSKPGHGRFGIRTL